MDLLPHNKRAYDAVEEALTTSPRTCVIHPTGTGKSYIAMAYIEAHPDERILFITSYLTTLSRFAADCKKNIPDAFSHLDLTIYSRLAAGILYDPDLLNIAKAYYEENGNLHVKRRCVYRGFNLGTWIINKRQNKKRGILTEEQIKLLDAIGMRW